MFLSGIRRRNPRLIEQAIALHQAGRIPANTYVIDTDAVQANAQAIASEAKRLGLKVFAMTKQMGRNADFCAAVIRGGIGASVAVDMDCARATYRVGMTVGHIGHLVQIPRAEADSAASMSPTYWTVFNMEKASEAAGASKKRNREQPLLARIQAKGDQFYRGHEGGFDAGDILSVADGVERLEGAAFAGITTFPALLFDPATRGVVPTPNLQTLVSAADSLRKAGRNAIEINAPGTTSSNSLKALAAVGVTQVEPGHGLTGTTPLHAVEDLPELPAVVYVSEVSHLHGGESYCFGGGLYIDPVFPEYDVKAIVSREPTVAETALYSVEILPPSAIDYYGMIKTDPGRSSPKVGDTVVFGFRAQIFVTRAFTCGISAISGSSPVVGAIHDAVGRRVEWPN